jgi:hypothetical protein
MTVLAVKRHTSTLRGANPLVDQVYAPEHRIEMLPCCDYVVVSAPLTSETRGRNLIASTSPARPLPVSQFAEREMPAAWSVCVGSLRPERV